MSIPDDVKEYLERPSITKYKDEECQSALKIDPVSASNFDPPPDRGFSCFAS